jgi:hypothetical protein
VTLSEQPRRLPRNFDHVERPAAEGRVRPIGVATNDPDADVGLYLAFVLKRGSLGLPQAQPWPRARIIYVASLFGVPAKI